MWEHRWWMLRYEIWRNYYRLTRWAHDRRHDIRGGRELLSSAYESVMGAFLDGL